MLTTLALVAAKKPLFGLCIIPHNGATLAASRGGPTLHAALCNLAIDYLV